MAKQIKRFQYQTRDPNATKRRATQQGGDYDSLLKEGVKLFKPKEGKNTVRIMPPTWDNADHFGYDGYINYGIGSDNRSYFSLESMKKERDPLHEARKQAEREGNRKLADALKPTKRVIYYVIDRTAEEEGPQVWIAPWTFDKKLANMSIDEDTGQCIDPPIDHPEEGCDVRFYYEKSGKQFPDYPADKMRIQKPAPLHEDGGKSDEWYEFIQDNPIPSLLNFYDYEHIAAAFDGHIATEEERKPKAKRQTEEEEDQPPPQRARSHETPRSTKAPPQVDDDEVDEETGEVTPGSNRQMEQNTTQKAKAPSNDDAPPLSMARVRERLAGRRRVQEDDPY